LLILACTQKDAIQTAVQPQDQEIAVQIALAQEIVIATVIRSVKAVIATLNALEMVKEVKRFLTDVQKHLTLCTNLH
jgi:transcriptional regulatory protein LevR